VADQFARRGIDNKRAREIALEIIDTNRDLEMLGKLGIPARDLRKRQKVLDEVRQRVIAPNVRAKPREVMRSAQPLLMQTGDVLVYPTFGGRCRNPYFVDQEKDRMGTASRPWQIDSWAAMVIVDSGRAFDFLAWYRPLTLNMAMAEKPSMLSLKGDLIWKLCRPGTCSASHFTRMGIEKIGSITVSQTKIRACFGELLPGISAAVSDISLANNISVGPYVSERGIGEPGNLASVKPGRPYPAIAGLMQVVE
jgi:hypothetical protein